MEHNIGRKLKILGCICILVAVMFAGYNMYESEHAGVVADEILLHLEEETDEVEFQENVKRVEMPVVEINNELFVGSLEIPSIGIKLPISSECTSAALKKSPCRYVGSVYENDMIIAGHNYMKHFSKIKKK